MKSKGTVRIECTGSHSFALKEIKIIQGDLKDLSKENYEKLRAQILEDGFSAPFFVWKDGKKLSIIDGTQRHRTLSQMGVEGYTLPDKFPCVMIDAKDEKQAKHKLLSFISQYGQLTSQGLYSFMSEAEIGIEDLADFNFPEINIEEFGKEFFEDYMSEPKDGAKELNTTEFSKFDHQCPKCRFEFNEKK